jgi:uncharacterized protein YlxW (UPF0749 family)
MLSDMDMPWEQKQELLLNKKIKELEEKIAKLERKVEYLSKNIQNEDNSYLSEKSIGSILPNLGEMNP